MRYARSAAAAKAIADFPDAPDDTGMVERARLTTHQANR